MKDIGGTGMPGGFDPSNMPENPVETPDEPVIEEID